MLYNLKPVVIDNVFLDEELNLIYNHINNYGIEEFLNNQKTDKDTKYFKNIDDVGYCAFSYNWPKQILSKLKDIVFQNTKIKVNEIEMHFARYTTKTGSDPQLLPHFDRFVEKPSLTLSVQLKKTVNEWPIHVDDFVTNMNINSAILFSGTHQIHFRDHRQFFEYDFCDILVCQFSVDNIFLENHQDNMNAKLMKYLNYFDDLNKSKNKFE